MENLHFAAKLKKTPRDIFFPPVKEKGMKRNESGFGIKEIMRRKGVELHET